VEKNDDYDKDNIKDDADDDFDDNDNVLQLQTVAMETPLQPSLSNVDVAYEQTLSRVVHHHRRHKECLSQAAEAHRKGVWGAAVHYSHQARQHKKHHDDAKMLAAELFIHQRSFTDILLFFNLYFVTFTTFIKQCTF